MNYEEEKHSGEMSKTSFVMIIVLCLLAIGAVSYFAISGMRTKIKENQKNSSNNNAYSSDNGSYNSSGTDNGIISEPEFDIPEPSSSVGKTESDIPYEETKTEESEPLSFIIPVEGNVLKGYSESALQYSATYGDMRLHTGIDIACNTGTDIKSATNGTVVSVDESATLGKVITVDHGGNIVVKYCGFESVNVKDGDTVKCGDVLGTSGTVPSEANDQPHIHLEVYEDSAPVSPLEIMGLN